MHTWQLQDAKAHFSEVVTLAQSEGPQLVTRHGEEAAVVLAAAEYHRLVSRPSLLAVLQSAPRGEALELERGSELPRDLDWSA